MSRHAIWLFWLLFALLKPSPILKTALLTSKNFISSNFINVLDSYKAINNFTLLLNLVKDSLWETRRRFRSSR